MSGFESAGCRPDCSNPDCECEEILSLRAQLAEATRLAERRLEEIKCLMRKDPHEQIVWVYGIPLDHYAGLLYTFREFTAQDAKDVLAQRAECLRSHHQTKSPETPS